VRLSLRPLALLLALAGCEQLIGADFSDPAEITSGPLHKDPPVIEGYESADAFCQAFTAALCTAPVEAACWQGLDCKTTVKQQCLDRIGSNTGHLRYEAKECVSKTSSDTANKKLSSSNASGRRTSCLKAFGKNSSKDGPCGDIYDCAKSSDEGDLICSVTGHEQRSCVVESKQVNGEKDQTCADPGATSRCGAGLFCDASKSPPVCAPLAKVGDPCSSQEQCQKLDPDFFNTTSICLETCRATVDISDQDLSCDSSLVCNGSFCLKNKCTLALIFALGDATGACAALVADPLIGTR